MIARRLRILLGLWVLSAAVACTPRPVPTPERPASETPGDAGRVDRSPPPAPRGPDISSQLLVTARVGALNHLDRRLVALVPPMVPQALLQGIVTRRLLPELARDLGLNALALEAMDLTRPSVFGMLLERPSAGSPMPKPRVVALLPLRGDPRLVLDALRESWPESLQEPWGGVHIRRGGQSLAWAQPRDGFVVVAPTAPLLDSAVRALAPLAQGVDEGTLHIQVRFADLVDILQGPVRMLWQMLKGRMEGASGGGSGAMETMLRMVFPLVPKLVPYLTSIRGLDLVARIADPGWSFSVKVTPTPGGKTAAWLGRLSPSDAAGLELLPPEAALVSVDRQGETARLLGSSLFGQTVDWVVKLVATKDLPPQVSERGLLDRPKPVPLTQYRRQLRDLNLEDYKASYAIYRFVFAVNALRGHLEVSAPRLVKASTGETSLAFYTAGGQFGQAQVEGIKDVAAHRAAMVSWAAGLQRHGNPLLTAIWDSVPLETRRELREKLGIRTNPLVLAHRPVAFRVGRVPVSSLSFKLRLPPLPKAGRGVAPPQELGKGAKMVETLSRVVEQFFGGRELTYSWAYVGNRRVSAWGHRWRERMTAVLQASSKGTASPSALADPIFQNARKEVQGESLSFTLVSGARLVMGVLDGMQALFPKMASLPGPFQMLVKQLRQDASAAQTATLMRELREDGAYQLELRVPNADLKTAVMGVGMFWGYATVSSPSTRSVQPALAVPMRRVPVAPGPPSDTSPPDTSTQP